jgi:hypothetical protein
VRPGTRSPATHAGTASTTAASGATASSPSAQIRAETRSLRS